MKKWPWTIFLLSFIVVSLSCGNPLNPNDQEPKMRLLVRMLVNDRYIDEPGRYVFFWDGKNDRGEFLSKGVYHFEMKFNELNFHVSCTALEDGEERSNYDAQFELGTVFATELEVPYPNPFHIKSGVNVPVILSESGNLTITIYKDK